jgi:type IV secretory pathway VirB6-like protein
MEVVMHRIVLLTSAAALTMFCASAFAQGASKAPAPKQRTAASLECSSQADAKGLHGTARKHFRAKCMREARAGTKGKSERGLGYR